MKKIYILYACFISTLFSISLLLADKTCAPTCCLKSKDVKGYCKVLADIMYVCSSASFNAATFNHKNVLMEEVVENNVYVNNAADINGDLSIGGDLIIGGASFSSLVQYGFFSTMSAAAIADGAIVPFDINNQSTSDIILNGDGSVTLVQPGIYAVNFSLLLDDTNSAFAITQVPTGTNSVFNNTVFARTGSQAELVGFAMIQVTAPNTVIGVQNVSNATQTLNSSIVAGINSAGLEIIRIASISAPANGERTLPLICIKTKDHIKDYYSLTAGNLMVNGPGYINHAVSRNIETINDSSGFDMTIDNDLFVTNNLNFNGDLIINGGAIDVSSDPIDQWGYFARQTSSGQVVNNTAFVQLTLASAFNTAGLTNAAGVITVSIPGIYLANFNVSVSDAAASAFRLVQDPAGVPVPLSNTMYGRSNANNPIVGLSIISIPVAGTTIGLQNISGGARTITNTAAGGGGAGNNVPASVVLVKLASL